VRTFLSTVFVAKPGWNVDRIFETYELFLYRDTNYNTNSFCKNLLKIAIPLPEFVNYEYILRRLVCSYYYQCISIAFVV